MNVDEHMIRNAIRRILVEKDAPAEAGATRRPGRGGYKKSISQTGALARQNPGELMKRLKITNVRDNDETKRLLQLFAQAVSGTPAMSAVYGSPSARKDNKTGLQGVRIPVQVIPPRDARKYLEHTLVGAQSSRTVIFDTDIQVEILGNDILVYLSSKPYSWGRVPGEKKEPKKPAKAPTPATSPTPSAPQSDSS